MTNIAVGDVVSWTEPSYYIGKPDRPMTGTVMQLRQLKSRNDIAEARVRPVGGLGVEFFVGIHRLTKLPATPAPPLPHDARGGDIRRACDADDWAMMMNAGDLGGVEIG